jgi:hypothetical protein
MCYDAKFTLDGFDVFVKPGEIAGRMRGNVATGSVKEHDGPPRVGPRRWAMVPEPRERAPSHPSMSQSAPREVNVTHSHTWLK